MEKKLGKSVVATGIAATTIISGSFNNQVKAEELTKETNTEPKTTEVTNKPVSKADLEVSKVEVDTANLQVQNQEQAVEKAQSDADQAQKEKEEAQAQVEAAQETQAEATPENIAQAQKDIEAAEENVAAKEEAQAQAQEEETQAEEAVKEQENKVAGQQSLVDIAEKELNDAKAPIAREEADLAQAESEKAQAEKNLANKQAALTASQEEAANQPAAQAQIEQKIQETENAVSQLNQAIADKENQISNAQKTQASTQSVDLRTTTYKNLLENVKNNGSTQAMKEAAAQALATYERAQREDGITIGSDATSAATLENNLKALELVKAINAYRRQAGLNELYIDPYANVGSQIQATYFENNGSHMFKYARNENIAISFDPQGAVNFWYSEKSLYQRIAAQYGLPTDERQLDANAIYMKVGASVFAQIGHYVQMLDNKATAISAAFNTHPNAYSSQNGTSAVAFYNVANTNEKVNNGTLLTAAAFETLLRNGGGTATTIDTSGLKNELEALKVQKTNKTVELGILKSQLADLQTNAQQQARAQAVAQQELADAEAILSVANQNLEGRKSLLNAAQARMADTLRPKEEALQSAQDKLAVEQKVLAQLQADLASAQARVAEAAAEVEIAKAALKIAQERLATLTNAPQALAQAQEALKEAEENLAVKQDILEEETAVLALYQSVYTKLDDQHNQLLADYQKQEGKNDTVPTRLLSGLALPAGSALNTAALDPTATDEGDNQTQSLVRGGGAAGGRRETTADPAVADSSQVSANDSLSLTAKQTYQGQAVLQSADEADPAYKGRELPSTGMRTEQFSILGMMTGLAALLFSGKRKSKKRIR